MTLWMERVAIVTPLFPKGYLSMRLPKLRITKRSRWSFCSILCSAALQLVFTKMGKVENVRDPNSFSYFGTEEEKSGYGKSGVTSSHSEQ
jgi:hypothetical protein